LDFGGGMPRLGQLSELTKILKQPTKAFSGVMNSLTKGVIRTASLFGCVFGGEI
jgi:hypothetical protein